MQNTPDGGPAFPHNSKGMSLRDWFAGQALKAIVMTLDFGADGCNAVGLMAYEMADAMLRARAAKSPAERQAEHLSGFGK
jgi:hypothetical protein